MASGTASRAKGVAGERESADVFRRQGFEVVRLQNNVLDAGDFTATLLRDEPISGPGIVNHIMPIPVVRLLVDAKRRERLDIVAASKQVEAVAHNGQIPCVAYRRNREPWRISLPLEDFARLLGGAT